MPEGSRTPPAFFVITVRHRHVDNGIRMSEKSVIFAGESEETTFSAKIYSL